MPAAALGGASLTITADDFIRKWQAVELRERQASQEHFIDLCRLLDEPTPAEGDPTGDWYCFERGATKTSGANGWADVWKRGCFGWEYKGKHRDLDAAFVQLQQYAIALENPPLLVTCDMDRIIIRTNWTNSVSEKIELSLSDLRSAEGRDTLKAAMSDPERLRPGITRQQVTEDAAGEFAQLAYRLRRKGHEAHAVAHFINRLIFCMFAEDARLLPNHMFTRMLRAARSGADEFQTVAGELFAAMRRGGRLGLEPVAFFNGGLFDTDEVLPLDEDELEICLRAAALNWEDIDPSIFGTLFVRGLDPANREASGSEYTDREKIIAIIRPVITEPLLREWGGVKNRIEAAIRPTEAALDEAVARAAEFPELADEVRQVRAHMRGTRQPTLPVELPKRRLVRQRDSVRASLRAADRAVGEARKQAKAELNTFLARLRHHTVLDPACGSGNFLYLALVELKNIEWRVLIEAEAMGFPRAFPSIGPEAVLGIEINPYAAELARVSVWIGEIQWMQKNGFAVSRDPILKPLDNISCRNAIINGDGTAAEWPDTNVIVGNPPYLGAKLMKRRLGVEQTEAIRALYEGRLPGFTDLVCYWFENARAKIEAGVTERAGLVATNSIRKNTNLPVMHRIARTTRFYAAWPEERWTVEGAAVDVSLVCFGDNLDLPITLDGQPVSGINPDLTTGLDLTAAKPLKENADGAYLGIQKSGPFDIPGPVARAWMNEPLNPNGYPNAQVLKPYWNGDDVTGRPRDVWLIDLPLDLSKADASQFESPFQHIANTPDEDGLLIEDLRRALGDRAGPRWWEPHWPRPEMRSRIRPLSRYIVTPETSQHRVFVWLSYPTLPDKNLIVIPRSDDLMFGLLHSRFHGSWSLRKGSDLQDRPRYTHTSTFATFPFPEGMAPDVPVEVARAHPAAAAIERAAANLDSLRQAWLFPPNLVEELAETVAGYEDAALGHFVSFPHRLVPRDDSASRTLAIRTLTALYNEKPAWLVEAHAALDAAVARAYGWPPDIEEEDAMGRLLELNRQRHSLSSA